MITGFTIKQVVKGWIVERFSINSQTFDVKIHETTGPFLTHQEAEAVETEMRKEHTAVDKS